MFESLIGLTPQEALPVAREIKGINDIRVVAEDGKYFMVTADYRLDRLNVAVVDGRIAWIQGIG